ncbi:MAG: magnesium chelatase [Paenibacillaceae bacterium]|jgi:MoxR-like ATPase|nr:magnesium chelatase [Paenibacillaceae bacterium]
MERLIAQLDKTIIGQQENVRLLVAAWLAGGHVLLEGVPGLGKTRLVRTLAELTDAAYRRIQFTPDMLPSDITGNVVWNAHTGGFDLVQGPVFANLVLADEINRTGPKTQAAMLEAMEEHQASIHGKTHLLPDPFFVVATQNPVEYEGTYPLPEAQLDRFLFKLVLDYPGEEEETAVLRGHVPFSPHKQPLMEAVLSLEDIRRKRREAAEVTVEEKVLVYITRLIRKTRELPSVVLGASPRAGIAVMMASKAWALLDNRNYVTPDDVKMVARPALRHRILLSPQAELEGMSSDQLVREVLASVPVPR